MQHFPNVSKDSADSKEMLSSLPPASAIVRIRQSALEHETLRTSRNLLTQQNQLPSVREIRKHLRTYYEDIDGFQYYPIPDVRAWAQITMLQNLHAIYTPETGHRLYFLIRPSKLVFPSSDIPRTVAIVDSVDDTEKYKLYIIEQYIPRGGQRQTGIVVHLKESEQLKQFEQVFKHV